MKYLLCFFISIAFATDADTEIINNLDFYENFESYQELTEQEVQLLSEEEMTNEVSNE